MLLSEGGNNVVWLEQPESFEEPWALHRIGSMKPDSSTGLTLADMMAMATKTSTPAATAAGPRDRDGEDVTVNDRLGTLGLVRESGWRHG